MKMELSLFVLFFSISSARAQGSDAAFLSSVGAAFEKTSMLGIHQREKFRYRPDGQCRNDNGKTGLNELDMETFKKDKKGECADFEGAYFAEGRLWNADLRGANLRGADFQGANLEDALLRGADMRNANLRAAILGNTDLKGVRLKGAVYDARTIMRSLSDEEAQTLGMIREGSSRTDPDNSGGSTPRSIGSAASMIARIEIEIASIRSQVGLVRSEAGRVPRRDDTWDDRREIQRFGSKVGSLLSSLGRIGSQENRAAGALSHILNVIPAGDQSLRPDAERLFDAIERYQSSVRSLAKGVGDVSSEVRKIQGLRSEGKQLERWARNQRHAGEELERLASAIWQKIHQ